MVSNVEKKKVLKIVIFFLTVMTVKPSLLINLTPGGSRNIL